MKSISVLYSVVFVFFIFLSLCTLDGTNEVNLHRNRVDYVNEQCVYFYTEESEAPLDYGLEIYVIYNANSENNAVSSMVHYILSSFLYKEYSLHFKKWFPKFKVKLVRFGDEKINGSFILSETEIVDDKYSITLDKGGDNDEHLYSVMYELAIKSKEADERNKNLKDANVYRVFIPVVDSAAKPQIYYQNNVYNHSDLMNIITQLKNIVSIFIISSESGYMFNSSICTGYIKDINQHSFCLYTYDLTVMLEVLCYIHVFVSLQANVSSSISPCDKLLSCKIKSMLKGADLIELFKKNDENLTPQTLQSKENSGESISTPSTDIQNGAPNSTASSGYIEATTTPSNTQSIQSKESIQSIQSTESTESQVKSSVGTDACNQGNKECENHNYVSNNQNQTDDDHDYNVDEQSVEDQDLKAYIRTISIIASSISIFACLAIFGGIGIYRYYVHRSKKNNVISLV